MRHTLSILAAALGAILAPTAADAQVVPPERPAIPRQSPIRAMARGEVPSNFAAGFTGPRAVRLSWTAPAGAAGCVVFRATTPAGPWTAVTQVPITGISYEDKTVAPKSSYAYRVVARYADKLEATTAPASVVTPCDKYCVSGDCAPKPATKLQIVEGSVGTGSQWRLTIKVMANDAASGAAVSGTVTINGTTGPIGSTVTYAPCRQGGRTNDALAEIVPCRYRATISGRGEIRLVTDG